MKNLIRISVLTVWFALLAICLVYANDGNVAYKLAKNYFVKNSYAEKDFHVMRITSKEKFDEIFGMASLMGKEGQPTAIDFTKSFVIALINRSSNNVSGIKVNSLSDAEDHLNLVYELQTTEAPQSFTSRYISLLIVDKKYNKKVHINPTSAAGPIVGGDLDEFGCKPSTGYTWSVLKKKCVSVRDEDGKYLSGSIGNLGLIFGDQHKDVELLGFKHAKYPQNLILKNVSKAKIWKNGNISVTREKSSYVLRDKKKELARSK